MQCEHIRLVWPFAGNSRIERRLLIKTLITLSSVKTEDWGWKEMVASLWRGSVCGGGGGVRAWVRVFLCGSLHCGIKTSFIYHFYTGWIVIFCLLVEAVCEWNVTKTDSCEQCRVLGKIRIPVSTILYASFNEQNSLVTVISSHTTLRVFEPLNHGQNTKRFKPTLIFSDTDTQYANFRGNPLCQTSKRHLNNS